MINVDFTTMEKGKTQFTFLKLNEHSLMVFDNHFMRFMNNVECVSFSE